MRDRTLTVKTVKTLDVNDIGNELWSGAQDRWRDADDDTREAVFDRICEWTADDEEVDMTTVNDLIWFECDDLFFPEDEEDEEDEEAEDSDEEDEEDEEDEDGDAPKLNTILIGRIGGDFQQREDGSVENTICYVTTAEDGEAVVTFVPVRFDGRQAELVREHLSKGDLCCVEGRQHEEKLDTGVAKQYIEAAHVTFLGTTKRKGTEQ